MSKPAENTEPMSEDEQIAREAASDVFAENYKTINQYVDILMSDGITWGLLGPREPQRMWSRHILNCAALADLIPEGSRVIDVGSGAGLPGIVLSIQRPDLHITLLEPLLRRFNFLGATVDKLGLAHSVTVQRGRAEDCPDTYDVVTARAVARLPKLLGWTIPLFYPDGQLIALKGDTAAEELDESLEMIEHSGLSGELLTVRADPRVETTSVIRVRRA